MATLVVTARLPGRHRRVERLLAHQPVDEVGPACGDAFRRHAALGVEVGDEGGIDVGEQGLGEQLEIAFGLGRGEEPRDVAGKEGSWRVIGVAPLGRQFRREVQVAIPQLMVDRRGAERP